MSFGLNFDAHPAQLENAVSLIRRASVMSPHPLLSRSAGQLVIQSACQPVSFHHDQIADRGGVQRPA
jgi:hypothetical protein